MRMAVEPKPFINEEIAKMPVTLIPLSELHREMNINWEIEVRVFDKKM